MTSPQRDGLERRVLAGRSPAACGFDVTLSPGRLVGSVSQRADLYVQQPVQRTNQRSAFEFVSSVEPLRAAGIFGPRIDKVVLRHRSAARVVFQQSHQNLSKARLHRGEPMDAWVSRRKLLALSAAGALAAALPSCSSRHKSSSHQSSSPTNQQPPGRRGLLRPGIPRIRSRCRRAGDTRTPQTPWRGAFGGICCSRVVTPGRSPIDVELFRMEPRIRPSDVLRGSKKQNILEEPRAAGWPRLRLYPIPTGEQDPRQHLRRRPNHQVPRLASIQWRYSVVGRSPQRPQEAI